MYVLEEGWVGSQKGNMHIQGGGGGLHKSEPTTSQFFQQLLRSNSTVEMFWLAVFLF